MKDGKLGEYLMWRGEPAKIVAEIRTQSVVIEPLKNKVCPHCKGDLGKDQITVIVNSPMYQEGAEAMPTITDSNANKLK